MTTNSTTTSTTTTSKDKGKRFARFIISFVIAFMAAVYFKIGQWMADFFAHGAIIIIIIIFIIILMGMLGLNPLDVFKDEQGKSKYRWIILVIFALAAWWIGGMICIHEGFEVTSCAASESSFLQDAGFPTLQGITAGIFSGESGSSGSGGYDIWSNDIFIALLVLIIFVAIIYGMYALLGKGSS